MASNTLNKLFKRKQFYHNNLPYCGSIPWLLFWLPVDLPPTKLYLNFQPVILEHSVNSASRLRDLVIRMNHKILLKAFTNIQIDNTYFKYKLDLRWVFGILLQLLVLHINNGVIFKNSQRCQIVLPFLFLHILFQNFKNVQIPIEAYVIY